MDREILRTVDVLLLEIVTPLPEEVEEQEILKAVIVALVVMGLYCYRHLKEGWVDDVNVSMSYFERKQHSNSGRESCDA